MPLQFVPAAIRCLNHMRKTMETTAATSANDVKARARTWEGSLRVRLREDAKNHPLYASCHLGPAVYHLKLTGSFLDSFTGGVKCICGRSLVRLAGALDGSRIEWIRTSP